MKKRFNAALKYFIRFAVSAALIWYIFSRLQLNVTELGNSFGKINLTTYSLFSILVFVIIVTAVSRWRLLLNTVGINTSFFSAFRMTYIGILFNNVMPGLTGGDVIKAYLLASRVNKKVSAIISILADRMIGFFGLFLTAGLAITPFVWTVKELFYPAMVIYGIIFCCVVAGIVYFNNRIRQLSIVKKITGIMPYKNIAGEIDRTLKAYKERPKEVITALGLSILCHTMAVIAVWGYGTALGLKGLTLVHYFSFLPVVFFLQGLPISLGGLGVGEMAYVSFFKLAGALELNSVADAVTLSLMAKIMMVFWALPGGLFLMFGTEKVKVDGIENQLWRENGESINVCK